jgi:murein DD-endopeptidase MepM/ murein hydrolase activator NlpD
MGIVTIGPAAADPGGDAKVASRRADRAEAILESATVVARTAALRLAQVTAAMPITQRRVATARGLMAAATVAANTARRDATTARAAYALVAARFDAAEVRVEDARQRIDDIAAASYMGGNFTTINILVGATGPRDAMDRLDLVDQVMQKQQDGVIEVNAARRSARVEQDQAGLAKRAAEDAEQVAADKLNEARAAETAAETARTRLVVLTKSRRWAAAVANSLRAVVLAQYQAARRQEARLEAALAARERTHGVATALHLGGRLLMPVQGWKSSDYGERYDPYYRVWQLHAGVDIAAEAGSPIHAAAAGRVIQAGWSGGYGNYTCVSNGRLAGRSFSTCYAHQSAILVSVGERVRRGEVIGRVGSTGAATGAHLHFETRLNGVPRNPLQYLPACLC